MSSKWNHGWIRGPALLTLTLVALLPSGCSDRGQLTSPPTQPMLGTVADPPLAEAGDTWIDLPDEPRLHLSFSVDGALVPGSPVTISVKADPRMEYSSAKVQVVLPELEAAKITGVGRAFRAPVGVELTKAGSWETGARAIGAESEIYTATVTFPAPGYYRVVGTAVTTPPKGQEVDEGRTQDRFTVENWLLITDSGGKLTLDFDEQEVPAGMVVSPGPFRKAEARGRKPTKAGIASWIPAVLRSFFFRDPDAVVRVKYWSGSSYQYASEAYGYAEFWDDDPWEGGEVTQTFEELVGVDGHYSLQCLGYYDWYGYAKLKTDDVSIYTYSGNWVSCGDTVEILIASQGRYEAMVDFKTLIPEVDTETGTSRSVVAVRVEQYGCGDSSRAYSCYSSGADRITLTENSASNYPRVAAHEYGHALHEESWGGLWSVTDCNPHSLHLPSSYTCSMLEGFAGFISQIGGLAVGGSGSTYWSNLDNVHYSVTDSVAMVEGNVAAFLWDLYDSNNEGDDATTYASSYLASVMSTCDGRPSAGWRPIDTAPIFVWCLENGVPSWAVQDSIFPNYIEILEQRESATEPGSWDADDIRGTAVQNIGG